MGNNDEYAFLTLLVVEPLGKRLRMDLPFVMLCFPGVVLYKGRGSSFSVLIKLELETGVREIICVLKQHIEEGVAKLEPNSWPARECCALVCLTKL